MYIVFGVLSIITGSVGLFFIVRGNQHPSTYQVILSSDSPSAVQVTQIYTEATHTVIVGIGVISLAILVAVIGILFHVGGPLKPSSELTDDFASQPSLESPDDFASQPSASDA